MHPSLRFALLCLALTACNLPDADLEADIGQEGQVSSELTNAASGAGFSYVVHIGGCTGTVIAPHYIVTAAHCFGAGGAGRVNVSVLGGQTSQTSLYNGQADVLLHPGWVDGAADRESWDIAVVHLRDGSLRAQGRAKIYKGPETPWASSGEDLFIEGYGFGSDEGGVRDCSQTNQQSTTKRRAAFDFRGAGRKEAGEWQSAEISHPSRTTCPGDSGSPYFIHRNDDDLFVAVHSRSERVAGGVARGSLVAPKLEWIQAFAQLVQPALNCALVRDHRGVHTEYFDCKEPLKPHRLPGDLHDLDVLN